MRLEDAFRNIMIERYGVMKADVMLSRMATGPSETDIEEPDPDYYFDSPSDSEADARNMVFGKND